MSLNLNDIHATLYTHNQLTMNTLIIVFVIIAFIGGLLWQVHSLTIAERANREDIDDLKEKVDKMSTPRTPNKLTNGNATGQEDAQWAGMNNVELLKAITAKLSCNCEKDESEENRYVVTFQGETFLIDIWDESPYIYIWDCFWYKASLDDIDEFSAIRQAINKCNMNGYATVLYTTNNEDHSLHLHCGSRVIFGSYIPHVDKYLTSLFENCFRQQRAFFQEKGEQGKN